MLPASSSLLLELYSNGTVKGLMNDQPLILRGCSAVADCKTIDFMNALSELILYTDMAKTCADLSNLKLASLQ